MTKCIHLTPIIFTNNSTFDFWFEISIKYSCHICCKATQLSRMLFVDSALTVDLVGQSTLNPGYSNDIPFWIFCSIASLWGDFLIRLKILYAVSILSFENRTFLTISPTAKFKTCPKQWAKNAFGFSDKILSETPFLIPHINFAPS